MSEIIVVAPYPKLAEIARRITTHKGYSVGVQLLQSSQLRSQSTFRSDADTRVFISRGGTAKYLREYTDLPVIEIQVTAYDVLRAIGETARKGYRHIAIITPSNIMLQADHFVDMTNLSLRLETCDDVRVIPEMVESILREEQVEAVIGDRVAIQVAKESGVHGLLLESGEASLMSALDTAVDVLEAQLTQETKLKETESVLNLIRESVIITQGDGRISMISRPAEQVLGLHKAEVLGRTVAEVLGEQVTQVVLTSRTNSENTLVTVRGKAVVMNHVPVIVDGMYRGSVLIFEEVHSIQKTELSIRRKLYERGFVAKNTFSDIITGNARMKRVVQSAERFAQSKGTVLISGESGTGKELFAQSIHNASRRSAGPFVSVNCAAIDGDLLNSELFGYEEGAFTGAVRGGRPGLFEMAHGGTIFLDEISETSLAFQSKLLRVIQEREIRRVGGNRIIPVDVRIICATNGDLLQLVRQRKFREDLFYRLNVLELRLPPLRERKEDIVPMAKLFLKIELEQGHRELTWHDDTVFDPLLHHDWPGNIRELQNVIHRIVVCCPNNTLTRKFVQEMLLGSTTANMQKWTESSAVENKDVWTTVDTSANSSKTDVLQIPMSPVWSEMESSLWRSLLERFGGNRDLLCQTYGISRTTLWRKLNRR
ncbi:MAG: sigma 54-interacting transcriptional regulator [Alicyclobacillus herbarius]|uniref:sigma 54-interacting transcriptional regulator n=1 Tax=Alicyclobacillus herbarius TaxID=122960 RepID=UPI002355D827|nr:sigma 54-interacting transcriptional regulator [Alicyclobacillus herbarius]MCL6633916.1 sigma 54-interacting transcriptional regulator [Alicyclobacillus herbarius]